MLQALSRWKTSILLMIAVLAVGLFASRHLVGPFSGVGGVTGPVSPTEAANHTGERTEVCGRVAQVVRVREIEGTPTFINLGGKHPEQGFTAIIWEDARSRWRTPPEDRYTDRTVCITGAIQIHDGTPQINVSSPEQIRRR